MNFEIWAASSVDMLGTVEVNTLDDLRELYVKYHERLVVDFKRMQIIVYDDYLE